MNIVKHYEYCLDNQIITTNDSVISGRQIRANAGLNPASAYILIEIGNNTSHSIGLEETIELRSDTKPTFLSFKSDRTFSLTINERGYEWGADQISATDIRRYANISDEHELILDSAQDKTIKNDETVCLQATGTEHIFSRLPEKIIIFVNTREKHVAPGKLTFTELVKLAFPDFQEGPNTSFTVSYRKGCGDRPEGTLIEGESIKITRGMHFNVSATDKS